MADLIEQWKKRTRCQSIAMISFALVQVTVAAALVWRMAARDPALTHDAGVVAAVFLCVTASYPLLALFRVMFVPVVLHPDAVVPASLLRELSERDFANALVRARSHLPMPAVLTFRELLELDAPRLSEGRIIPATQCTTSARVPLPHASPVAKAGLADGTVK